MALAATFALGCLPAASDPRDVAVLGTAPLCEASAIHRVPGVPGEWLVADNEVRTHLFAFTEAGGRLVPSPSHDLGWPGGVKGPKDIEALAGDANELIVVGSHHRGGGCLPNKGRARRQLLRIHFVGGRPFEASIVSGQAVVEALQQPNATVASCQKALFAGPPPPHSAEVCQALLAAEKAGGRADCSTLNIEGAATLPSADGPSQLWLGLRSPLAGGRAILLRVDSKAGALRFDAAALLPLGGRSIRALAADGDRLFGLASADRQDTVLFEVQQADRLGAEGRPPLPTLLRRDLPKNAEGLEISRDRMHAWIVTDGAEAASEVACKTPAGQIRILGLGDGPETQTLP